MVEIDPQRKSPTEESGRSTIELSGSPFAYSGSIPDFLTAAATSGCRRTFKKDRAASGCGA